MVIVAYLLSFLCLILNISLFVHLKPPYSVFFLLFQIPAMVFSPALAGAGATVNALDYFGVWKLLDALQSCSLAQIDCEYAFGNTNEQRFMGLWSDGVSVYPMESTKAP